MSLSTPGCRLWQLLAQVAPLNLPLVKKSPVAGTRNAAVISPPRIIVASFSSSSFAFSPCSTADHPIRASFLCNWQLAVALSWEATCFTSSRISDTSRFNSFFLFHYFTFNPTDPGTSLSTQIPVKASTVLFSIFLTLTASAFSSLTCYAPSPWTMISTFCRMPLSLSLLRPPYPYLQS